MIDEVTENRIAKLIPILSENHRSRFLALEVMALSYCGIQAISTLTGASGSTITISMKEALQALVSESTIGNPENPLRGTNTDMFWEATLAASSVMMLL